MSTRYFLSLGSNIGEREKYLADAVNRLNAEKSISIEKISSLYETAPWGKTDQNDFLNIALSLCTTLSPEELLFVTQRIENELGRTREEKWGARTIDIDLLFCDKAYKSERLTLPHPYMCERAFVLVPLDEIAGSVIVFGKTVRELLANCPDKGAISKLAPFPKLTN